MDIDIKFGQVQIFVSDITKAEKWYSSTLNMKLIEKYSKFKCMLMKLGEEFYIETPCPEWGEGWNTVKTGGRTPIIFETKDIQKTVKELKKKGVKFVEEISKRSWGEYKAVFSDPDGNEFNLVQI
ncbi:MAG: VOC family protein [Patescibacteria group bacterium]